MRKNMKRVCNADTEELLDEVERRMENMKDNVQRRIASKKADLENALEAIEEAEDTLNWL